ncbi:MAG: symmetrical bis(5'-nucleosyl)-tetraphosphatase [Oceanospirillaceae bacterium]|nr:symmetrical bis(5'-nucleosyl)-tetraphosphatase [Oceanospirillaceae bacterium]
MATYAIGDIQGCFDEFQALLQKINFSDQDQLWLAGDLVNRGPKSLETLRFIKQLGDRAKVVLGNHDLHLLAIYYSSATLKKSDTLASLLQASDCDELMHWLKAQPLVQFDPQLNIIMTHAGIPVDWSVNQTIARAREVEAVLQSDFYTQYFNQMYGNTPSQWHEYLTGLDRLRCITNTLTRMRFCNSELQLDLNFKGEIGQQPKGLTPWFEFYDKGPNNSTPALPMILFGHWAALMGQTDHSNIIALDTGCVWGERLTAMCLETQQFYSTPSLKN